MLDSASGHCCRKPVEGTQACEGFCCRPPEYLSSGALTKPRPTLFPTLTCLCCLPGNPVCGGD